MDSIRKAQSAAIHTKIPLRKYLKPSGAGTALNSFQLSTVANMNYHDLYSNGNDRRSSLASLSATLSHQSIDDSDTKLARNDPLYGIGPQPDGMYHCFFEKSESCGHKPTKLKCNYEYVMDCPSYHHASPLCCLKCFVSFVGFELLIVFRPKLEQD